MSLLQALYMYDASLSMLQIFMYAAYIFASLRQLTLLCLQIQSMNAGQSGFGIMNWIGTRMQTIAHMARSNTIEGSRKNVGRTLRVTVTSCLQGSSKILFATLGFHPASTSRDHVRSLFACSHHTHFLSFSSSILFLICT